jgi:hypothetical protein
MRYGLRTLVILTAIGPPVIAAIAFIGPHAKLLARVVLELLAIGAQAAIALAVPFGVTFALAWIVSLVARLFHVGTHPDNRR